jgi:hypothetical protein
MATLSELRDRILRILSDAKGEIYSSDLILDGIVAGLDAILPWIFKQSVVSFTADGETAEFELPDDVYRITSVFESGSGVFLPLSTMTALKAPGDNIAANNDWCMYPEGNLSLANMPDLDITVTVYYAAMWEKPVDDDDVIEAPSWVHRAIVFYAASYAILEKASSSANIRQWNQKIDSGTPVMNPMRDMSTYYLERFRIEMERMPGLVRGTHG